MQISPLTLHRQFLRFDDQVRANSGQAFRSFREGLPAHWENYKEDVRIEALRLLELRTWKRSGVGSGHILKRVIAAIEIHDPGRDLRNNLVAWQNRFGHEKKSHRALLNAKDNRADRRQFEEWFLNFFQDRLADAEAFEAFCKLAGKRYDLLAYMFFLKDWTRFMPIAPMTFDEAFSLLELNVVTAHHCSWKNYDRYNEALIAVQRGLREVEGITDTRLIDAHSFCWILVRLELPKATPKTLIPLPQKMGEVEAAEITVRDDLGDSEFDEVTDEEFDERAARRRRLGKLAQDIALQSERKRLSNAGHLDPDNAAKPVWHEAGRGYDILSCELDGTPRQIEVKAARSSGGKLTFFLSANEWEKSRTLPNYHFYLVTKIESTEPTVKMLSASKVTENCLTPVNFLASLRPIGK